MSPLFTGLKSIKRRARISIAERSAEMWHLFRFSDWPARPCRIKRWFTHGIRRAGPPLLQVRQMNMTPLFIFLSNFKKRMFGCQYPAKLGNSTAVCRGRNEVDDKKKIEKIKEKEREKVIYLTHGSDRKSCSTKKFSLCYRTEQQIFNTDLPSDLLHWQKRAKNRWLNFIREKWNVWQE